MMEDLKHPLYEWTQVVTDEELHLILQELQEAILVTPWWSWKQKAMLGGAYATIKTLLIWLHAGKPSEGFNANIN